MRKTIVASLLATILFATIPFNSSQTEGYSRGCEIDSRIVRKEKIVKIERKDSFLFITLDSGQKLTTQERVEFIVAITPKDNFSANRYPFVVESHCKDTFRLLYAIHFSDLENFKKYNSANLNPLLWIDAANIRAIRHLSNNRYFVDFYGTSSPNSLYWNLPGGGNPEQVFTIEIDSTRFRFPQLNGEYAGPIFNGFLQGYYNADYSTITIMVSQFTISFPTEEAKEEYFKVK